jgi:hypothetical protein
MFSFVMPDASSLMASPRANAIQKTVAGECPSCQVTAWAGSSENVVPLAPPMVAMAAAVPPEVRAIDSTVPCNRAVDC